MNDGDTVFISLLSFCPHQPVGPMVSFVQNLYYLPAPFYSVIFPVTPFLLSQFNFHPFSAPSFPNFFFCTPFPYPVLFTPFPISSILFSFLLYFALFAFSRLCLVCVSVSVFNLSYVLSCHFQCEQQSEPLYSLIVLMCR